MHSNCPNYKLMQYKHIVYYLYQNSCTWHEHTSEDMNRTQGGDVNGVNVVSMVFDTIFLKYRYQ